MDDMQSFKELVTSTVTCEIDRMLLECTDDQMALYRRLYPSGPSYDQLSTAYDQAQRTVIKNRAKATGAKTT